MDQPYIYGIAGTSIIASSVVQDLLHYAWRHDSIICIQDHVGGKAWVSRLPLLPSSAANGNLGQQQERGRLHDIYVQIQRNVVYLAINDRPTKYRKFPADAVLGKNFTT